MWDTAFLIKIDRLPITSHHIMLLSNEALYSFEYTELQSESKKFKVKIGNITYEVTVPALIKDSYALSQYVETAKIILDDCTREVQNNPPPTRNNQPRVTGELVQAVWVRALHVSERPFWDNISDIQDLDPWSVDNWKAKVREWLLTKFTIQDYEAVAQQLRNWRKPRKVKVVQNMNYMLTINKDIAFFTEAFSQASFLSLSS